MCGIAGVWVNGKQKAERAVRAMNAAQAHRGPDDEGAQLLATPAGWLGLGHRRLSILDLSSAGHQPMANERTGDWIVFNGEIYNFRELRKELEGAGACFKSQCDTEVILHAYARWGRACFGRLCGMFALGLYDAARRRLVLARDPLGIKPLYYGSGRSGFAFGSEVRALLASGLFEKDLDRRALAGLLAYGAVPGPLTMYKALRLLEPGTWCELDLAAPPEESAAPKPVRFWDFPKPGATNLSAQPPERELRERLGQAVRSHLLSDVPVGVFLSSGLDSTALALLAREAKTELDTFSVVLPQDGALDEGETAARTARSLGTRHHAIRVPEEEAKRLGRTWLDAMDQPSLDGLNTYLISHAVRQRGIRVALSGLGGDELFGGYPSFRQVPSLARWFRLAGWVPAPLRQGLAGRLYPGSAAQKAKFRDMAKTRPSVQGMYFRRRRLLCDAEMEALGFQARELDLNEDFLPPECEPERGLLADNPEACVGILESRFYMGNMLLRDSDVFGMAHGLEIRVPLLDRRLVEWVSGLSRRQRFARGARPKALLANALGAALPEEVRRLKKRGFSLPIARWLKGPLRERLNEDGSARALESQMDAGAVRTIWRRFRDRPDGPEWSRAWMLGVVGSWVGRLP